ncbi:MAG: hypothetical protein L6R36_009558 [Xanthoria steineri]|nr:MAG: hypothetical protein L6R36_009558 [Xanthoria steineri]
MASNSSIKKQRLEKEILRYAIAVDLPCFRCLENDHKCVVMDSSKRLKCAECVKQGKPCIGLTWESLDRTRDRLRREIDEHEEELAEVMAKLMRKKKILRQADERAKRKAECLASEMEADGELDAPIDCPAADATVGLSPAVWGTLGQIDDFINFGGSGSGANLAAGGPG